MRLFLLSLFALCSFEVEAFPRAVQTLRDIPWSYTGQAGDLFNLYNVKLEINQLVSTKKEVNSLGVILRNEVKGHLNVGQKRSLEIKSFDLIIHEDFPKNITAIIKTKDNFVKSIMMNLRYDLIKNEFSLREVQHNGQRSRLLLKGQL